MAVVIAKIMERESDLLLKGHFNYLRPGWMTGWLEAFSCYIRVDIIGSIYTKLKTFVLPYSDWQYSIVSC